MSTQPVISNSGAPGAPVGALVFLRGENDANFAEIHSSLLTHDCVVESIPAHGDWNMLLRLSAKDKESLKQLIEEHIHSAKGVKEFQAYYTEETWTVPGNGSEQKAAACALLDVDPGSIAVAVERLRAATGVVEGAVTDGGKKIVLFLKGNSPREIRSIAGGEIRLLPGVLRVKLINVMN